MTDLATESNDVAALTAVGQVTARYNDAQTMLLLGNTAQARGMAMDQYAFPDIGVPLYSAIGPQLDRCVVYSVARTESGFNQRDRSPANAVGLMQVTPEAGRDTAKRFGVAYDWNRLVSDPVYNTQMGAAEVAALLKEYRGSYVMAFAGYNAGRGRVAEWVAKHGDPRDPKIDAVDWVERIPFAETRNYVQRVMENLQVYCARFGASTATVEPNLHRAAPVGSRVNPVLVEATLEQARQFSRGVQRPRHFFGTFQLLFQTRHIVVRQLLVREVLLQYWGLDVERIGFLGFVSGGLIRPPRRHRQNDERDRQGENAGHLASLPQICCTGIADAVLQ